MSEIKVIADEIMFRTDKVKINQLLEPGEIEDRNTKLLIPMSGLPLEAPLGPEDWKVGSMKQSLKQVLKGIQGNTGLTLRTSF